MALAKFGLEKHRSDLFKALMVQRIKLALVGTRGLVTHGNRRALITFQTAYSAARYGATYTTSMTKHEKLVV
jgi:hypothetical protein